MQPSEPSQSIITGQQVTEPKIILARQMRREMTACEALLWSHLRASRLGVKFRRQQIIDGFIADFYCHSESLIVEVDGPIHDLEYDNERDHIFASKGLRVLRITNQEVEENLSMVLLTIRGCLGT